MWRRLLAPGERPPSERQERELKSVIQVICLLLGLIAGLAGTFQAQTPPQNSGIAGTVTDQSGAVFPSAVVTVVDSAGKSQAAAANDRGEYSFPGLPAGSYTVSVAADGFKKFAQNVTVAAGSATRVDIALQPAEANTKVEVVGQSAVGVETDTAQVSGTITEKEVVSIGLNGRNFTQLIALAPGVSNQTR